MRAVRVLRGTDMLVVAGTGILSDTGEGALGLPYELAKWSIAARLSGSLNSAFPNGAPADAAPQTPATPAEPPVATPQPLDEKPAVADKAVASNTAAAAVAGDVQAGRKLAETEGERVRVSKVEVWENEGSLAVYREE